MRAGTPRGSRGTGSGEAAVEESAVHAALFHTEVLPRHGTMRGISFVSTCFAFESDTDMLAGMLGLDPIESRKRNLLTSSFAPLLDACAEKLGYGVRELEPDRGIGFAICTPHPRRTAARREREAG